LVKPVFDGPFSYCIQIYFGDSIDLHIYIQ
jgi:hypothetical protein